MKRWGFAIALFVTGLFFCSRASGQTTSVTGTIVDPASQAYANGSYTINFHPNGFQPSQYHWTGGTLTYQFTGLLNGSGAFSVSLPDNTFITPVGSQWDFQVCPAANAVCTTVTLTVLGSSQNISSSINAALPTTQVRLSPQPNASPLVKAYNDTEIVGPVAGALYYNLTDTCIHTYNGTAWNVNCPGSQFPGGGSTTTLKTTLFDDFLGGTGISQNGVAQTLGWVNNGGGGGIGPQPSGAYNVNHPGVVEVNALSGTNQWEFYILGAFNTGGENFNPQAQTFSFYFAANDDSIVSPVTSGTTVRAGLFNNRGTQNPNTGVWFEAGTAQSNSDWWCVQENGGTASSADSGVAAGNVWHTLEVDASAASTIVWKVDSSQVCNSLSSTNLPNTPLTIAAEAINVLGTNAARIWLDYFRLDVTTTGR